MTTTYRRTAGRISLGALVLLGALACNKADPATTTDLERDLEQTKAAELDMANQSGRRTDVVSSMEQLPSGQKAPAKKAQGPKSAADVSPTPDKSIADIGPVVDTSVSTRPRAPTPPKETRRGPYKSTSDIIRNAPFPITP